MIACHSSGKDILMKNGENQRLRRVNECFLGYSPDPDSNIRMLTNCCGELMGAACALYNRLEGDKLHTLAQWNAPPDFNPVDRPDGHICHDVIRLGGQAVFVLQDLDRTGYAKSDPNVTMYCLKTYIGAPVSCKNRCVGSLCVVYQTNYTPDEEEKKLLQILAVALGVEEERREELAALRALTEELEERVARRTADLGKVNEQLRIDIAERKQAEEALLENMEKLYAITDSATDAIVMMDNDGKISFWNPAAETIFGYRAEEAQGKELHTVLAPARYHKSYREGYDRFRKTGEGGAIGKTIELDAIRKGGVEFPMELSLATFRIKGKWHAAGIMRDITERRQAKMELVRTNEELEKKTCELIKAQEELVRNEKMAAIGRLAGCVGHELRNPLGVMNNAVFFLKTVMADADDTVGEYLEIIKQEIDNSQRIISDLLDFSRTIPPRKRAVIPRELIIESIGRCAIPENINLQTELSDALPPLRIDPLQIGQVFQNIITNAVQEMPEGGALHIAARKDDDFVEISIADTGDGILPENMEKLFQPLFTTKARGIGLGLVVCRNLTEANGGRIAVDSKPGEGAVFTVTLPVA